MRGLLAWLRVRGGAGVLTGLGLMALAAALLPTSLVRVPLRTDAGADAQLLVGAIAALGLGAGLFPGLAAIEVLCPRPKSRERAAWLASVTALVMICLLASYRLSSPPLVEVGCRNFLLCAGLTLLTAVALPRIVVWMPVTVLVACTWLFGTSDLSGSPRSWAILFLPPDPVTWVLCGAVFGFGAASWIVRDGRPEPA